jgi:ABC-type uncharacterized transport system auxiliary subunit
MRTNRLKATIISLACVALLAGCASESDVAGSSTELKGGSATKMEKGDNVDQSSATVIHDPSQAKAGGSYKLEPPDPNDPKFKPDPKLGGGG